MSEGDTGMAARALLQHHLDKLGVVTHPDPAQWRSLLERVAADIEARDRKVHALEEVAASSTEELLRLRQIQARQYRDLEEMLEVLANGVAVFREAVAGDQGALTQALDIARHRFSLHLNAEWCEGDIPEDTADLDMAGSSVRALQISLKNLSGAIADLVQQATTMASSRKELELAGAVQQMLVPPASVEIPGARIHSWFQPAAHCGGDWWTAHPITADSGLMVIGDVTGHGAPSAIITGAVKGACDLARMGMRGALRPSQLLRMLNRVIAEAARGEYMMTSIAMTVRRGGEPRVLLTNAGHRPPWLIRNGKLTVVQGTREPPLGAQVAVQYTELSVHAQPGDVLVLLTDGIPEAEDANGSELGERALRALCERHADLGAEGLRDKVREAVNQHVGSHAQLDDISLIVFEIT